MVRTASEERDEVKRQKLRLRLARLRRKFARTQAKLGKLEHRAVARDEEE